MSFHIIIAYDIHIYWPEIEGLKYVLFDCRYVNTYYWNKSIMLTQLGSEKHRKIEAKQPRVSKCRQTLLL